MIFDCDCVGIVEALERIELPACVASSGSHEKTRLTLGLPHELEAAVSVWRAANVARGAPHRAGL